MRKAAGAPKKAICFECFRVDRRREHAIKAGGGVEFTAEHLVGRFQDGLPFEPVDIPRLARLKFERAAAKRQARTGAGQYVDKRRQAQIAARHALHRVGEGLRVQALHAAELQLPDAWLPFVASR